MDVDVSVRRARPEDREAVVSFTSGTWPRLGGDYVPDVFDEWVATDGSDQRTFVAVVDDVPVGICQGVTLSAHEAWAQGMRVDADHRGRRVGAAMCEALFSWAAGAGATVCRNMVFSWNAPGLGQSRAVGFEPLCSFRWLEFDADADTEPSMTIRTDSLAAWSAYHGSDAYRTLVGLGLDLTETWALAELTPTRLRDAPVAFVVTDGDAARGMSYLTRTFERETDGERALWAEYGVGVWDDHETLRSLVAAVAADAATRDASMARMAIPDTPRHVSDAAYERVDVSEDADLVLERDLAGY